MLLTENATFLLALNSLQQPDNVGFSIGLIIIVCLIATGFVLQELRTRDPIIDLRFFRDIDFALLNGAHTLLNLSSFAILLLVPFYLARIDGLTTPAAGLLLAASPLGVAVAGPLAARLTMLSGRQMALMGAAAACSAQLIIGSFASTQNLGLLAAASLLQGFGAGLFQLAYFDIATGTLPPENRGVAGSLVMMTRTIGLVTGATLLMLAFRKLSDADGAQLAES
ncbi:MAG: MFS transporter, partial [Sphingobacteriales bacterium]